MEVDEQPSVFLERIKEQIEDATLGGNQDAIERPEWVILEALPETTEWNSVVKGFRSEGQVNMKKVITAIEAEEAAWKEKFQNEKLSGNKRKIGESSMDQSANYTQNRRQRTGKSNSTGSSRRDSDDFFCTFCSKDDHNREQCFLDPKRPSFDQRKVDDLLARNKNNPSNSKYMKKMVYCSVSLIQGSR
eukprot:TRINITY_DN2381_c1_g1_i5.p1 TRINITY_DN2381_c1_g1~~TRINITY_DN2381_c1_g1_i5.p1  ORF type:complete len:189 (-),score=53.66 TRINITY_DN2381_c1_g1_i5:653-1219(-)